MKEQCETRRKFWKIKHPLRACVERNIVWGAHRPSIDTWTWTMTPTQVETWNQLQVTLYLGHSSYSSVFLGSKKYTRILDRAVLIFKLLKCFCFCELCVQIFRSFLPVSNSLISGEFCKIDIFLGVSFRAVSWYDCHRKFSGWQEEYIEHRGSVSKCLP